MEAVEQIGDTADRNLDVEYESHEQGTENIEMAGADKQNIDDSSPNPEKLNDIDSFFGIEAIDRAFEKVYAKSDPAIISSPDFKYWAGGDHPLDYIKVYKNSGNTEQKIVPHWHYVTYGFSDLHGDGRVHSFSGRGHPSGRGFELTLRVTEGQTIASEPPHWPLRLLDNLARYVFNTGIELKEYDHIPWHESLDKMRVGGACNASRDTIASSSLVRNMLIVEDPQILNLDSPHGTVTFLQIVGILENEFLYARSWKACAIIDQLLEHPQVGPVMVTDLHRKTSVFDLNPLLLAELNQKMDEEGSHLGRVTAHFQWRDMSKRGLKGHEVRKLEDIDMNVKENDNSCRSVEVAFLQFEPGAAELLPLMVRGRLRHGMTFTFSSVGCVNNSNVQSVQFVAANATGMKLLVDEKIPMRKKGNFLQIRCSKPMLTEMARDFNCLEAIRQESEILPLRFHYQNPHLLISVVKKLCDIESDPVEEKSEGGTQCKKEGQYAP